jgi:hypothetical protein
VKITTINTIELSSLCDNDCEYCPAQAQRGHREVGLMSKEVFEQSIKWVKHYCGQNTQLELNLFGVGEPTLNPNIAEFIEYARHELPFRQNIHLNTNGNRMSLELAEQLKLAGVTAIDITAHNAKAAAKTIRFFKKVGIGGRVSLDFITNPNNWAGQVDWFAPDYHKTPVPENICPWLGRGQIMVMSDGSLTNCCIDAFAQGVFGTIFDDLTKFDIDEMPLCKKCHHITPHEFRIRQNHQITVAL